MDEAEVVRLIGALPGAVVITAGPDSGAPEVAWGDTFAFFDPDDDRTEFAFDALDRLVPHPVYGRQGWVSVLVPGPATERQVRELVAHAHERARRQYARRGAQGGDIT